MSWKENAQFNATQMTAVTVAMSGRLGVTALFTLCVCTRAVLTGSISKSHPNPPRPSAEHI